MLLIVLLRPKVKAGSRFITIAMRIGGGNLFDKRCVDNSRLLPTIKPERVVCNSGQRRQMVQFSLFWQTVNNF